MPVSSNYSGFDYSANQIFKFLVALDYLTIILKNGEIIHHMASDATSFCQWLTENNIPNIRAEEGWIIKE